MTSANNVREFRVAFMLTPAELAARMGADATDVERIEAKGYELTPEWIEAVATALGVPPGALTDPAADVEAVIAEANVAPSHAGGICPIASRFAILSLLGKLAGLKLARRVTEDDLGRAIQNLNAFIESEENGLDLNRLMLGLRITVLAILQSRQFSLEPPHAERLEKALPPAASFVLAYSRIDGPLPA